MKCVYSYQFYLAGCAAMLQMSAANKAGISDCVKCVLSGDLHLAAAFGAAFCLRRVLRI